MVRRAENTSFICFRCGTAVSACDNGSYRNHCSTCLWSVHVDVVPGDRACECRGPMAPIGLTHPRGKRLAVVHECLSCGVHRVNRLAPDDNLDELLQLPPA